MSKRLGIAVGLLVVVGLAVGYGILHHKPRVDLDPSEGSAGNLTATAPDSIRSIIILPFEVPKAVSASAGREVPPECREFWRLVSESRLDDLAKEVATMGWNRPEKCLPLQTFVDPQWEQLITQSCSLPSGAAKNPERERECLQGLAYYRSQVISYLTRDQNNFFDMPKPLLIHKLVGQIAAGGAAAMAYSELVQLLDALKKREPDWYDGQKAAVAALFIRSMFEKDTELLGLLNERLNSELDRAVSMNGHDPEVLEMELFRQMQGGEDGRAEIERFTQEHPTSPVAQYYLAASYCRTGDKENCLKAMDAAIKLDPENDRFKSTRQRVADATDLTQAGGLFHMQFRFNILD